MIYDLPSMLNPVIFKGLLHLNILKCCWWLPAACACDVWINWTGPKPVTVCTHPLSVTAIRDI